ncbi:MAG: amidophosphoribosyltransferase, partial [Alphaproteobacteria bacterium]
EELLAAKHDVRAMEKLIGVDSLAFISMDGLYRAMGESGRNSDAPQFCDACFSGDYPISLTDHSEMDADAQMSLLVELT